MKGDLRERKRTDNRNDQERISILLLIWNTNTAVLPPYKNQYKYCSPVAVRTPISCDTDLQVPLTFKRSKRQFTERNKYNLHERRYHRAGSHATVMKQLMDVIILKLLTLLSPHPPSGCYVTHGHGSSRNRCISIILTEGKSSSFCPSGQGACTLVFVFYCLACRLKRISLCFIKAVRHDTLCAAEVQFHIFLNSGEHQRCGVTFKFPGRLNAGEKIAKFFSFNRRLGGSHIQSGRTGEKQKDLPLPTIQSKFLGCPARGLFTTVNCYSNMAQK